MINITTTINQLGSDVIMRAIVTLAFFVVSLITGFKLILKYLKSKEITILFAGFAWIFIGSPYWGFSLSFLSILLFSYQFEHVLFLFLSYGFVPLGVICWIYSFGKMYNKPNFKQIFYTIFIIFFALFIIQIVMLFLNHENIAHYEGTILNPFQYRRALIPYFVSIPALLLVIISGTIFCKKAFGLHDPYIVWKGRFLLVGFYIFVFGMVIDISSVNLMLQIIARIILIISSFFFYFGFFLPSVIAKKLVKE